jgi:hypothetical protein
MLWFEHEVVGTLIAASDPEARAAIEAFVDGSLRDMPEHLRLGVAGESVLLGAYVRARRATDRPPAADARTLAELLDRWETSRIGVLRQYVRMMKSMVAFAENELTPEAAA